jgi:hypothetical protein
LYFVEDTYSSGPQEEEQEEQTSTRRGVYGDDRILDIRLLFVLACCTGERNNS